MSSTSFLGFGWDSVAVGAGVVGAGGRDGTVSWGEEGRGGEGGPEARALHSLGYTILCAFLGEVEEIIRPPSLTSYSTSRSEAKQFVR